MSGRLVAPAVIVAACSALIALGCGGDDVPADRTDGDLHGTLTVFAAATLTESFDALADAFEEEFDGVSVRTSFAASSDLAAQIAQGAPADVYASADEVNMQRLVDDDLVGDEPVVFATNRLEIVVEPGNPLGIESLDDLADPGVVVVTAAPAVPIGRYTADVLENAGVDVTPRSLEENVRGVLNKVALGEADAGIVYVTDRLAAGERVTGVPIPDDVNTVARHPIATTRTAPNPHTARAFVEFVASDAGRAILADHGFGAP